MPDETVTTESAPTAPTEQPADTTAVADAAPVAPDSAQAAQTEQQTADDGDAEGIAGEDGAAEDKDNSKAAAPAEYDFSALKPEDDDMEVDKPTAEAFAKIAQKVGLDQAGFATVFNELMPFLNQRQEEHLDNVKRDFIRQGKADPDMGGAKWGETKTLARKALLKFTDAQTRDLLHASGLDCHPGVIKMFRNIQLALSDDVVVSGSQAAGKVDPAKAFFPNSRMN